jgi:hypothetical protein
MAVSCCSGEPPDQIALQEKENAAGPDPAAEADILNADVRPYR